MPDYNKGDFTQQGVDGFVEGGLHLNEKRCLTAKISTDEDSAGLDSVEINIHDHLNDLDYTFSGENVIAGTSVIGQAPSGNIDITSTEQTNVAEYATAQVVDENLVAGNIKKDVEILGVTGTFEGGLAPYSATLFLFNGTNIAITEDDGVYVGILDLPNYVFIPNTGDTVNVKINSNDPVPYDVSFDLSTQQFSLGDPDLINTDYCIQGVLRPDGFAGAILGKQAETLTRLTISFNRTGYKTNWHVRAHDYGFLKFGLDYADVYYGVCLNSTSIETTTNVPCPMEVGNAISITTIGVTSSPK